MLSKTDMKSFDRNKAVQMCLCPGRGKPIGSRRSGTDQLSLIMLPFISRKVMQSLARTQSSFSDKDVSCVTSLSSRVRTRSPILDCYTP